MSSTVFRGLFAGLLLAAVPTFAAAGSALPGAAPSIGAEARCPLVRDGGAAPIDIEAIRPSRLRVGEKHAITPVRTAHPYRAGRGTVQVEEIHVPGASYVAPYFSRFDLAPGDYVVVRSPSGERQWRYEGEGKPGMGRMTGFWGIHVPGDRMLIELHGAGLGEGWGYRIDTVARGFPLGTPPNPICGDDDKENARCYEHSHPLHYQQARAVARLLINGTHLCTGWLLGPNGHLMTNGHCITSASDAANTNYEFMAEGSCAQTCGTLQCPGTIVSTQGSLIRRNYPDLDYSLVQLDTNPSGTYGYLKLRTALPMVGETIYLPQHPGGWGKQIALYSTHPNDPTGYPQIQQVWPTAVVFLADINYGTSGSPVLGHGDHCVMALQFGTLGCEPGGPGSIGNVGMRSHLIIQDLGSSLPPGSIANAGESCGELDAIFRYGFE